MNPKRYFTAKYWAAKYFTLKPIGVTEGIVAKHMNRPFVLDGRVSEFILPKQDEQVEDYDIV